MPETMRAVVIREPGGPDVLELRDVRAPTPAPGEVRLRVAASGLNRADVLQRLGRYPVPEGWPADIPGLEVAGTVDAIGGGVTGVAVGDRLMGVVGGGGYAELVCAPAESLVRVPDGLDDVAAAAVPEVFMTAFDALFVQEGLEAGETVLVHAVGSGVGTAAVQLARRARAMSIGTSRTPDKLARAAELGLNVGLVGGDDWPARVLEATRGRGVDVILDLVGGPYVAGNQLVLAERARWIVVGVTGGPKAEIDLRALMGRRASIRGTVLRARPLDEKVALARAFEAEVLAGFDDGSLVPVIDRVFDASDAADAHRYMESNESFGKLLLRW
jgi:putative PIG3 family NAD(P)H quinone oxidoreductase